MANIIEISKLVPLKFYTQEDLIQNLQWTQSNVATFNPNFNFRNIDEDFFVKNIPSWMDATTYKKPFQQGDVIPIQFLGQNTTDIIYRVNLINSKHKIIKTLDATQLNLLPSGMRVYKFEMQLYDVPEDCYAIQIVKYINAISVEKDFLFLSEPFHVKQIHENTSLIQYTNSYNTQNVIFDTSIRQNFVMRIHGSLVEMNPQADFDVYENQTKNLIMLNGDAYRLYDFRVGIDNQKIPEYILDQLNSILLLDSVYVDSVQITRVEGAQFEANREDKQAKFEASIKVRETEPNTSYDVNDKPDLFVMDLPTNEIFYIEELKTTLLSFVFIADKMFTSVRNLLDYLNSYTAYNFINSGYFCVNSKNKLVYRSNIKSGVDAFYSVIESGMILTNLIDSSLIIEVQPTATIGFDLSIDFDNSSSIDYAIFWGDSNTPTTGAGSANSETHTYTTAGTYTAYLFMSDIENIDLDFSNAIVNRLGGMLPPNTLTFASNGIGVVEVTNNMFAKIMPNTLFSISFAFNTMSSTSVSTLIRYLYEARNVVDTSFYADLSGQINPAPPNTDVQQFISDIGGIIVTD